MHIARRQGELVASVLLTGIQEVNGAGDRCRKRDLDDQAIVPTVYPEIEPTTAEMLKRSASLLFRD